MKNRSNEKMSTKWTKLRKIIEEDIFCWKKLQNETLSQQTFVVSVLMRWASSMTTKPQKCFRRKDCSRSTISYEVMSTSQLRAFFDSFIMAFYDEKWTGKKSLIKKMEKISRLCPFVHSWNWTE